MDVATAVDPELPESTSADTPKAEPTKRKWKLHVPSAFTILFFLTILAVLATWVIPAGQYEKLSYNAETSMLELTDPTAQGAKKQIKELPATQETLDELGVKVEIEKFTSGELKKPISVPGTYERLQQRPQPISSVVTTMVNGTIEAIDIIVFILVLGGLIGVVRVTGAFESGLVALTKKTKGKEFALVFAVSVFMLVGGSLCGLEEEAVAFYPILVPIFLAMGYDAIICVGAIFLAGSMGTAMSTINPFSVVIASNAAGIKFTDGLGWRIGGLIVGGVVVIAHLYWYSKKIKANLANSYTYEDHKKFYEKWSLTTSEPKPFTWQRKLILACFASAFVIMVIGVMQLGWWFPQMAASFLTITIIVVFLAMTGRDRLGEKDLMDAFAAGSSSLVGVSLIIGLARGINRVMEHGLISDTILDASTKAVQGMPAPLFIIALMFIFFVLGFVVPSSSGLAVLSMPIFAPLADTVHIPRFIVVCAYQWGQYAMLFLAPTGLVMATLQMLDMKYTHWFRYVWPLVAFLLGFGGILLVAQVLIYGDA